MIFHTLSKATSLIVFCAATLLPGLTGADPSAIEIEVDIESRDPMELTGEMKTWISQRVFPTHPDSVRARNLINAINDLGLEYEVGSTKTASEVFETGKFNCVSFSFLFVSLSRFVGLDTHFLRAIDDPGYTREGELIVVSEHMSAGLKEGVRSRALEFRFLPDPAEHRFRRLTDQEAAALFYSNIGGEALLDDRTKEAIGWFAKATETEPSLSEVWVNYGVALRRSGDQGAAEEAYLQGLRVDPNNTRAYLNLASLMWRQGREDASSKLLELLEKGGPKDPYAFLVLGDHALQGKRYEDAERFYRRAIRKDRSSGEARAALGHLMLELGEPGKAAKQLAHARKRDSENPRTIELEQKMQELAKSGGPESGSRD